jgi:hypothetical protein
MRAPHFSCRTVLRYGIFILSLATIVGCASSFVLNSDLDAPTLKQSLAAFQGRFDTLPGHGEYQYSRRKELIDLVLAHTPGAQRDRLSAAILSELVDCLDDPSPSASMFGEQTVPVGWVCHAALTGFVYHEAVDADGDIAPAWVGYPSLPASPQDMQAAKSAWEKVISGKQYRFP